MNLLFALTVVSGLFGGGSNGCASGNCGASLSMGASISQSIPTSVMYSQSIVMPPPATSILPSRTTIPAGYRMVCDEKSCRLVKIVERIPYAEPGPPMHLVAPAPVIIIEQTTTTFQFYKD